MMLLLPLLPMLFTLKSKSSANKPFSVFKTGVIAFALLQGQVHAQESVEPSNSTATQNEQAPAPFVPSFGELKSKSYDTQVERLSELMGSVHFLKQLCNEENAEEWRQSLARFINAENPSPQRRAKFISRFNQGYHSFSSLYRRCTPQAELAITQFLGESSKIIDNLVARYGE